MPINLLYRESSTETPPSTVSVKGSPLTSKEIDSNFKSISNSIDTIQSNLNSAESTLQSNIDTVQGNLNTVESTLQGNIDTKSPISHAVNANTYGLGTSSVYGHLKVVDSGTNSASTSTAASPKYVSDVSSTLQSNIDTVQGNLNSVESTLKGGLDTKSPISHAVNANTYGLGTSSVYGHVKISDSGTSAASSSVAASPKYVSDACAAVVSSLEADLDSLIKEYS